MTDFATLLKALRDARVEFVIVGAYAAVAHGSSQVTRDLDICYSRSPQNLKRLASALARLHPRLRDAPPGLPFRLDAEALRQGMNFTLVTDAGELDLMGELSGVGDYRQAAKGAARVVLHGIACRIASLEVLIRSKRAAARPKDLNQISELEALQGLIRAGKLASVRRKKSSS